MVTGRWAMVGVAVAAVVVTLAGCGSDPDPASTAPASIGTPTTQERGDLDGADGSGTGEGGPSTVDQAASPDASILAGSGETGAAGLQVDGQPTPSPLGAYLGDEGYGAEASAAGLARRIERDRAREALIVECMAAAGLTYVAVDPGAGPLGGPVGTGVPGQEFDDGSAAWAARWGFGHTTTRFSAEEVGDGLLGHQRGPEVSVATDPNLALAAGLRPDELEAWFAALYGEQASGFEVGGCLGDAVAATEAVALGFHEEFGPALDGLYAEVEADARITEAQATVGRCVAAQGLTYSSAQDTFRYFDQALSGLLEEAVHPADGLTDVELAQLSAAEVDELLRRPRTFSPQALDTLGRLQAEEIALAIAVQDCGGGRPLATLRSQVTAEYEEGFIAANSDALAPYQAAG